MATRDSDGETGSRRDSNASWCRGKWILENLLGTSPPPPPPNVPELKATGEPGMALSMRDRMVQHRADPVCVGCHAIMDPIGLSLENFDAVGQVRTLGESSEPIDASGALPDGTKFVGAVGLPNALLTKSDQVVTTMPGCVGAGGPRICTFSAPTGASPASRTLPCSRRSTAARTRLRGRKSSDWTTSRRGDANRRRVDPKIIECKGDDAPTCLTTAQVTAARKIYAPIMNPRTRQTIFPGLAPGSELA